MYVVASINPPGPSAKWKLLIGASETNILWSLYISISLKKALEIGLILLIGVLKLGRFVCMNSYGFVYFLLVSQSSIFSSIKPFI